MSIYSNRINYFLLVAFLFVFATSLGFARSSDSSTPHGYWQCTYVGDEWRTVIGPGGVPEQRLQPTFYSSKWRPTEDAAKNDAFDYCDRFSATSCSLSGCDQHSRN